jgi:hypothetical protein
VDGVGDLAAAMLDAGGDVKVEIMCDLAAARFGIPEPRVTDAGRGNGTDAGLESPLSSIVCAVSLSLLASVVFLVASSIPASTSETPSPPRRLASLFIASIIRSNFLTLSSRSSTFDPS